MDRTANKAPGHTTLVLLALLTVAAIVVFIAVPTYPNYDSYYHLVWGRELVDGLNPSFNAYSAPTEHPLFLAVAVILQPFGESADRVLVLLTLLSLAALIAGVFRLSELVFNRVSAIIAVVFVGSSFAFLLYAVRAYLDVPFLAIVIWAAVAEVSKPRRGTLPMALLMLAGLLRPEAWLLGAVYWVYCLRGSENKRVVGLGVLAIAAPLAWFALDWVVTGDPLFSLHSTSELADALGRKRGLANVPKVLATSLADTVRSPVALLGLVGIGLAWWRLGWKRLIVPLALFLSGVAVFIAAGIFGLALIPRYLGLSAVGLVLFAGYTLGGFASERDKRFQTRWLRISTAVACLGAVFVVLQLPSLGKLSDELHFVKDSHDDLAALLADSDVNGGLTCGPLTFPNYRLVPEARWMRDLNRKEVRARSELRPRYGVAVFVVGRQPLKRFAFADGASPSSNAPDPGFNRLDRHGEFVLYESCQPGRLKID